MDKHRLTLNIIENKKVDKIFNEYKYTWGYVRKQKNNKKKDQLRFNFIENVIIFSVIKF